MRVCRNAGAVPTALPKKEQGAGRHYNLTTDPPPVHDAQNDQLCSRVGNISVSECEHEMCVPVGEIGEGWRGLARVGEMRQ